MTSSAQPPFGQADLSNCEREQIHLAGSIQPHGALLILDEAGTKIVQASANASAFLNIDGDLVGRTLNSLQGDLASRLHAHLDEPLHRRPVAVRGQIGTPAIVVDALVRRPADGGIAVEIERAGPAVRLREEIEAAAQSILNAHSLRALADLAAGLVKRIAGYDRVMVYRFDDLGHGEVYSECREERLEAFLGNRYPASDIPQIARRLYLQNRIRLLVDVDYEPVPLTPRLNPLTGRDLDMSMCGLRSMSPIHLQYLKNMGVQATLVLSLVVGGELWGLIACHHYTARFVPFEARSLCEIIGELVATRIAALESVVQSHAELMVRRLEKKMVEALGRDGDWQNALFDSSKALLGSLRADGAALVYEGIVRAFGDVPATSAIRELAAWLDRRPRDPVVATAAIGHDAPDFAVLLPATAGLLATPVSSTAGEYLMWFRPERKTTVTWGGDPTKPVIVGTDPRQLSPRLSFAQWHEVVEGTSEPWTRADLTTGRLIGRTIAHMVLQFRSVRLLIAQDQLATLSRQVGSSSQPILLANASGRILLTNEAFAGLLQAGQSQPQHLDDLPPLFAGSFGMTRHLDNLLRHDCPFRDEGALSSVGAGTRPLAIRGEPVFVSAERKLGYILHFEEITDRKAAEAARSRFEDGMIDHRKPRGARLDPHGDREFEASLAPVVENARLAALEITYGVEAEGMPRLLESVRASVTRTADLLEHLIWHASGVDGEAD